MIYNDNPILPSDVLVALQNAYRKQSNDTQQKTNELLGSFFVLSQKVCLGIVSQKCLPDDLANALIDVKKAMTSVTENLSELFGISCKKTNADMCVENVFGICKNVSQCITILACLTRNEPNKCRAISNYISQLSTPLCSVLKVLEKKDIAIRQYL